MSEREETTISHTGLQKTQTQPNVQGIIERDEVLSFLEKENPS